MKPWKKYVALNLGMVIGVFVSIFIAPESTPVWIWALVACTFLAVMNYLLFRKLRSGQSPESKRAGWGIAILGLVFLLLDLILTRLHFW